ncbi:arabinogalactan oligomer/maltooligosaccharide transport system permease protein [Actinoalloteichus hymeniacidonis]|uniref:Carbohydrate ABC transporter membrane protein 1, CUT1 family n=2 Tax=Actinoalloteichus hymeniacidonis TaxID=340345 RepID=A0AAC9MVI9_9PSEU|nr:sugar ABC transporter permease [Actinoalloteichus hymeniacidonis]AOS61228.1 carbohydrate ABC transporter membrane protein 1, CUT1 family [Actinoalloteichus hymeniacidonis]MBB5910769.1 arabinogalactan oligomer/maltooligosaccharide transport system permease protein [Actinoalloteichus hymeniacidonis]
MRRFLDRYWYAYAMVLPVVVVISVLVLLPLGQGVFFTITDINENNIANPILDRPATFEVVGLANYLNVLSGDPAYGAFWSTLVRTLIWTFSGVFFHYVIGLGLAMLLNRPMRMRSLYRVLLILPWAVPAFISAFSWRYLFNADYGLINWALDSVGLPTPVWLGQSDIALVAVIIVNVWLGVPFMMVALLGGLQSIPADLYEAAEIDGASPWQRFVHVTVPALRSVSNTVVLLGIIWTFNMFAVVYLVTGPNPNTRILITYAFERFFSGATRDYAIASTYGVLILSVLLVFASVYRRALKRQGEVW